MIVLATCLDDPELYESDRLYAQALRRRSCAVSVAPWDGPANAFENAEAVVLRATWGYYRALDAYRAWIDRMAAGTRLFNPPALVRWNIAKTYLAELAKAGVAVPRSFFVDGAEAAVEAALGAAGWDEAVVKPVVGASGFAVERVRRGAVAATLSALPAGSSAHGLVLQEYLPEIAEGEISLVYFDGHFSHAIRKTPPAGEFRANSRFRATRALERPSPRLQAEGAAALAVLPERPLYARVDGVARADGLIVLELEVVEPALFMEFDPPSADRFAVATLRRLGR